jgi:hypothetical protein
VSDASAQSDQGRESGEGQLQNAGAPFTSWLTLLFLFSVLVLMAFDYPNGTYTIGSIPLLAVLLVAGWFGVRKRVHDSQHGADAQEVTGRTPGLSIAGKPGGQNLIIFNQLRHIAAVNFPLIT